MNDTNMYFDRIKDKLYDYSIEIEDVKKDMELLKMGYKINLIIDFEIIYNLAYAYENFSKKKYKDIDIEIGKQAARSFLFDDKSIYGSPILLPPYENELLFFMKKMKKAVEYVRLHNYDYLKTMVDKKLDNNDIILIQKAIKEYKNENKFSTNIKKSILSLIKDKFFWLYLFISIPRYQEALKVIDNLYCSNNETIIKSNQIWPKYFHDIIRISNSSSTRLKYIGDFNVERSLDTNPRYYYPNITDAKVVEIFENINKKYNTNNEITLLVTDATSMINVLEKNNLSKIDINFNGKNYKYSLLRTSYNFFIYMLFYSENINEIISNINKYETAITDKHLHKKLIDNMMKIHEEICILEQNNDVKIVNCEYIEETISLLKNKLIETPNLKIGGFHKNLCHPFSRINYQKIDPRMEKIYEFFSSDRGLEEELYTSSKIFMDKIYKTIEDISIESRDVALPIIYINLASEIRNTIEDYKIYIKNKNSKRALYQFISSANSNNLIKMKKRYENLIDLSKRNRNIDHFIIKSLLLMGNQNYEHTCEYINDIINKTPNENIIEDLNFIKAKSLSHMLNPIYYKNNKENYQEILRIINSYDRIRKDPKWLNLFGTTLGKAYTFEIDLNISPKDILLNYKNAMKQYNKNPKLYGDNFIYYIYNNIGYTYYIMIQEKSIFNKRKEMKDLLKQALININNINEKKIETMRNYEIMHTMGCVYEEKYLIEEAKKESKMKWLKKSLYYFEKALKFAFGRKDEKYIDELNARIQITKNRIDNGMNFRFDKYKKISK